MASLPTFRKLWGRIEGGLEKGKYELEIDNQYEVKPYDGKKYFMLSTSNSLGGKNSVSGTLYLIIGVLSLVAATVLFVEWMIKKKID